MMFTNTFQLSNHSSLLKFDVYQYFQIPKSYSSLLRTVFTIATTFNSPDRIAIPPKCLQFEVPTNTLYTHYIEVSIYSNSYFKLHSPAASFISLKFTLKEYAADTVTCAFLRFRLDRHGGKFSKPTESFNQHAPGIYNNAAQK